LNKFYKFIISFVFIVSVIIGGQSPSLANDYTKGVEAYEKGDFTTALKFWQPLAEQGDTDAQYNLGQMYRQGQGVQQDNKTAVKWYTLAAEQGIANAQVNLGVMYRRGEGVPQAPPHLLMMPAKIVLILNQSDFDGGGGLMLTWQGFAFVPRPQILKAEREYQPRSLAPAGPMQACG